MQQSGNINVVSWLRLAWRMLLRDWRAGELRLLSAALLVAVAAVSSVGFLSDRLRHALERDAAQLLGADLVLTADATASPAVREAALDRGLRLTDAIVFPSMAMAGDGPGARMQLAAVKAVDDGYPLRGTVRVQRLPGSAGARAGSGVDEPAPGVPAAGTVWLDAQLMALLGVQVGSEVGLGDARFTVSRVISFEPDRGMNFINVAPRLMMRVSDLESTGLMTVGSRTTHRLLVAGAPSVVEAYRQWLEPRMEPGQRLETLESGRPEMRQTLERARLFLSLVALLAALIAAVALALAARRYLLRHLDSVAVMRCLGATRGQVSFLVAMEFLMIALAASAVGCLLGYAVHEGLLMLLGSLVQVELPPVPFMPAFQGAVTGIWLLLGFALPPLVRLTGVPPARVLRREGGGEAGAAAGYGVGAVGFALLLLWFAGDLRLGLLTAGGFLVGFAVFALLAWLGLKLLEPVRQRVGGSVVWRFALAGVVRRRAATVTQICALAIGLMALLLLAITRTDLVDGWRRTAPADAPNRFIINIQPAQRPDVADRLSSAGLDAAVLHPVVRGRLVARNGEAVGPDDYAEERARRMVDREFNLSFADQQPSHNRIVSGQWLDPRGHEVSLESGVASTLGLALGDKLSFDVAGNTVDVEVTSVRDLDWDSMAVNFYAILSPAALEQMPQSWITSFHLPATIDDPLPSLVNDFPNLTVFDVSAILSQVQRVLEQVVAAVQALFLFTLAAGVLVLYAALAATRDERVREAGLLRALGATQKQLARAQWLELSMIGLAAGGLAAGMASVLAWLLARNVFHFALTPPWWVWVAGLLGGLLAALIGGQSGLRGVLRAPPLATLRDA